MTTTSDGAVVQRVPEPSGAQSEAWVAPTWEEIVTEHSARVYRLAYRLTGNKHDAEDLTHDVFIRVFRSLDSYQPGTFDGLGLSDEVLGVGPAGRFLCTHGFHPTARRAQHGRG